MCNGMHVLHISFNISSSATELFFTLFHCKKNSGYRMQSLIHRIEDRHFNLNHCSSQMRRIIDGNFIGLATAIRIKHFLLSACQNEETNTYIPLSNHFSNYSECHCEIQKGMSEREREEKSGRRFEFRANPKTLVWNRSFPIR